MDRGAWQATVHGVVQSWTRLKRLDTYRPYPLCVLCLFISLPFPPYIPPAMFQIPLSNTAVNPIYKVFNLSY